MAWKKIVGIIILAVILRKVWRLCLITQPWKVVYNHAPGPCHLVPPIANGSEDMQFISPGKVLITSGIKIPGLANNPRVLSSPGQFYLFDFNAPQEGAQVVPCNNFPDYGTKNFGPHGMSVLKHDGEIFIFVVNHPFEHLYEKHMVEKFKYDAKKNELEHLKTYSGDYLRLINDVVAVGPESFYVTNWIYSLTKVQIKLETIVGQFEWSTVVYYDNGKTKTVADGLLMANGVSMSRDKKYVYVYNLGNSDIRVYERKADGSLNFVQSKVLPTTACDNFHVDSETGEIWTGCHPLPFMTMRYMDEPDEHRPLSPSQVLRIKTKDGLLTDDVIEVYSNDGTEFTASTIAVFHRDTSSMIVGSIDKNLLYCEIKTL